MLGIQEENEETVPAYNCTYIIALFPHPDGRPCQMLRGKTCEGRDSNTQMNLAYSFSI